ncbi:hypothetical protein HMPREF0204_12607 [Chryseobacterium gleum ATCC 35910]|uniref:Uncharacterized protein n=1 Tax=Chryseobacterium gleum ATCC 35910 TaxID=525257 RepID=A0ABN0AKG9_CHRGE|nr:hypothetical protein HMPREF0204_12607 [Chryseobacterium gleum ATCC 35910]
MKIKFILKLITIKSIKKIPPFNSFHTLTIHSQWLQKYLNFL